MNIIQKWSPNFGSRQGYNPELLVIHVMDGSLSGTDEWFTSINSNVSSHYGVGLNGEIHQYVQNQNAAWTEGNVRNPSATLLKLDINPNLYCLSVEHEGQDLSKAPEIQLNASMALVASLIGQYNIPCDRNHIIGHYEIDSVVKPNCPTPDRTFMDMYVKMVEQLLTKQNNNMSEVLPEGQKRVLRITKVETVFTWDSLVVDANDVVVPTTGDPTQPANGEQTVTLAGTQTIEALVTYCGGLIESGADIKVEVGAGIQ